MSPTAVEVTVKGADAKTWVHGGHIIRTAAALVWQIDIPFSSGDRARCTRNSGEFTSCRIKPALFVKVDQFSCFSELSGTALTPCQRISEQIWCHLNACAALGVPSTENLTT